VATMKDVARAVGVSQASVSYAYTRPEKLSLDQRDTILRVAAEMGYFGPHPGARSLRTGRVGAVGLMITDSLSYAFEDPATTALLQGIARVHDLGDVAMTLMPCPGEDRETTVDGPAGARASQVVMRSHVDGFLIYSLPNEHAAVQAAVGRSLPMVVIDAPRGLPVPYIGIRDRLAAREAATHLLAMGHREIGVLVDRLAPDGTCGPASPARIKAARDGVAAERLAGYAAAWRSAGLRFADATVVEAGVFLPGQSRTAVETLLDRCAPTAVLATTDVLALVAIEVLTERGLRVPQDVSVVGFDDLPMAAAAGLTTVAQPLVEKGRRAAELLLTAMTGVHVASVTLPTKLVVRSSTAPPRRNPR
jgi:DNA-binding LacI/PurR family transcriptional regulator